MKRQLMSPAISSPDDGDEWIDLSYQIAGLGGLDIDRLRLKWRARLGRAAPAHLPKHLFVCILAYRPQAEAYGDLDREAVRMLSKIAAQMEDRRSGCAPGAEETRTIVASVEANPALKPGTMRAREHGGAMHRVMVLRDGFAWNGATYGSLSDVARAITGTKWNGPRFFGLHYQKRSPLTIEAISSGAAIGKRAKEQGPRTRGGARP